MKHSIDDLLGAVYRHYPRGIARDDPRYEASEEYMRLSAARREAGGVARERWRSLLRRLDERLPGDKTADLSLHLPTGQYDACYSGCVSLPLASGEHGHTLDFLVGFVVPYYVVYSERHVDDPAETKVVPPAQRDTVDIYVHDTMYVLPRGVVRPEVLAEADRIAEALGAKPRTRQVLSFEPSPDELPLATLISAEIEATFGCERMPPEVGCIVVPEVATNARGLGEATLYDCLLTDSR